MFLGRCPIIVAQAAFAACIFAQAPTPRPGIAARSLPGPIKLDGKLDEAAWSAALAVDLTQQAPRPGEPSPYKTQVRVLTDNDNLYFAFRCEEPNPRSLAIHTLRRDGSMEGDEAVAVVLDPFGDRRNGYIFRVNAAGARQDGLISAVERASFDWDGIWDARTARTPFGWTVEIAIPTRTLNFTRGLPAWGVNFERFAAAQRISLRWSSPTLDSYFTDMSRAGNLTGVDDLRQGNGIEISPYLVGRATQVFGPLSTGGRVWQGSPGVDATWRITPQLAAVFTANTDFAETEVDSRQVNTTRFPLFFPERRQFFLEGSGLFSFGVGLDNCASWRRPCFIPFFSRRIGLSDGNPIPIDTGAKLIGRVGDWNVAALHVKTRETRFAPAANLFASRVSYDFSKQFRLGATMTYGDPSGVKRNGLLGMDGAWRTSRFQTNKNLQVAGWAAASLGDLAAGSRLGYGGNIEYPNDRWDCYADTARFGEALNPALGFLPRLGVLRLDSGCAFKPRPRRGGQFQWIRQHFFEAFYSRVQNLRGFPESWRFFTAPLQFTAETGDRVEFNWVEHFEFLARPFEVVRGVAIPPGAYRYRRWRGQFETSPTRPFTAETTTWWGAFYNGTLLELVNSVNWSSTNGQVQLGVNATTNFGRLPQGSFAQRLWQVQGTFAWSPNVSLSTFLQYDSDTQNVGTNTRLRWIVKPGNDVFLVWNRGWQRIVRSPDELAIVPERDALALKIRWTFRR
jgi:hypothetical protein